MKRFLTTSLVALSLFIGAAGAAPTAHAAGAGQACGAGCDPGLTCDAGTCQSAGVAGACLTTADCGTGFSCQNSTCQPIAGQTTPVGNSNAAGVPSTYTGANTGGFMADVMTWIMSLFAWLVGIAMVALNYAMFYTVLNMGNYVSHLAAVGVTWRILRDLGNIVLIFGFLAVGITTILNVNWYGGGKKMLPLLLIVAVFLNFSLFISEAVIDVGNLFATQFYTQISGGSGNLPTAATLGSHGISDTIMAQFGLAQIYGGVTQNPNALLSNQPWYTGFMAIILFIILTFVLFSLAFILIARFVILLLLIIVAPIGFAGLIVPKLDNTAKLWWSTLFRQTITAPVLLLLLYIALAIITDANFLTGFNSPGQTGNWLALTGSNVPGFAAVFLPFLVGMGLLGAVVMVANRMSAFGAGWATKTAGTLSFGVTAWAATRTFGRGADLLNRRLARSTGFNKFNAATGSVISRTLNRGATGTFDFRGTGALKAAGLDAGAAAKGGFVGARERTAKAQEEEAKRIEEAHKDLGNRAAIAHSDATENLAVAKQSLAVAQKAEKDAKEKTTAAGAGRAELGTKITQLEKERMNAADEGRPFAFDDELKAEREKLSRMNLEIANAAVIADTASQAVKEAHAAVATAAVAESEADTAKKGVAASIKANKIAYAEGTTAKNPVSRVINFVAYGPGTGEGARAVIKKAKETKTTQQQFTELAAKLAKEQEEATKAAEVTGAAPTTPAPAAPAG